MPSSDHYVFSPFSPFVAVSLFGVAGLAETFPSFSVSGPFLHDFPGFQVPSDGIAQPQLWSSSRALSIHLNFCNCWDVFSFISSYDLPEPFHPSPSNSRVQYKIYTKRSTKCNIILACTLWLVKIIESRMFSL